MRTFPSLSTCRLLICAHILRDAVNLPARIRKMCALFELGRKCAQMDLPWRGGEARNVRTYQESGLRGREMCAHSPVQRCKRCDSATVRQCDQPTPADPPKNRSTLSGKCPRCHLKSCRASSLWPGHEGSGGAVKIFSAPPTALHADQYDDARQLFNSHRGHLSSRVSRYGGLEI